MHPIQDLFWECFSYELQFDMHSYLHKNFILAKSGCYKIVGQVAAAGPLSQRRILEGGTTGQHRFMGKLKRSWYRVGSAPYGSGRASSGGASRGQRVGLRPEEEDDLGGPELGRVHWS
jgi:hypothetical protein